MPRVLALTQLLIVGLGGPILYLLVKIEHKPVPPDAVAILAEFLAAHVLWLFAVPILYAAIAGGLKGKASEKAIKTVGIAICVILVTLLGSLIVGYLL